jgi:secreted PhoX family phosphatase
MGRFAKEMALVMPDSQTVYFGDDGTDRVLYKFVATTAGDLSAGTLYAAKVTQDKETLNLQWIALGSAKDSDIEAAIRQLDAQFTAAQ